MRHGDTALVVQALSIRGLISNFLTVLWHCVMGDKIVIIGRGNHRAPITPPFYHPLPKTVNRNSRKSY